MSKSYPEMKNLLIQNYAGVSRIVSDILNDLGKRLKPTYNNSAAKFALPTYLEPCRGWRDYQKWMGLKNRIWRTLYIFGQR